MLKLLIVFVIDRCIERVHARYKASYRKMEQRKFKQQDKSPK